MGAIKSSSSAESSSFAKTVGPVQVLFAGRRPRGTRVGCVGDPTAAQERNNFWWQSGVLRLFDHAV